MIYWRKLHPTPSVHVTRFEEAVPSLNDIFIRVAGERVAYRLVKQLKL